MTNQNFYDTIRHRREELGLTQKEMADAIGVDIPMYSRIERGNRPIKSSAIARMASALKLDAGALRRLWLVEKVISVVDTEEDAVDILSLAVRNMSDRSTANI